jgi:pyruvate kinase
LMVARGDLGVELPAHEVPLVQKNWFAKKMARIPVIVATKWWRQWLPV